MTDFQKGFQVLGVIERSYFGYDRNLGGIFLTIEVDTYLHGYYTFNYTCDTAKEMLEHYQIADIVLLECTPVILEWNGEKFKLKEIIRGRRIS